MEIVIKQQMSLRNQGFARLRARLESSPNPRAHSSSTLSEEGGTEREGRAGERGSGREGVPRKGGRGMADHESKPSQLILGF